MAADSQSQSTPRIKRLQPETSGTVLAPGTVMLRLVLCFSLPALLLCACNDQQLSGFDPNSPAPPEPTGGVEGIYQVYANPNQQSCGQAGVTTFVASEVEIWVDGNTVYADWGLANAPGVDQYTEPVGSLDGARFVLNWTYSQTGSSGFTTDYVNRWNGDFTSEGLLSHLEQEIRIQGGLAGGCDLLWQVAATKY